MKQAALRWVRQKISTNPRLQNLFFEILEQDGVSGYKEFPDHRLVFHINDTVGRAVRRHGDFDRESVIKLYEHLASINKSVHDITILEVGANIGTQSVYFCKEFSQCRVISIEPDPENMALLNANVVLNGLDGTVKTHLIGASDTDSELEFIRNAHNKGASCLIENADPAAFDRDGNLKRGYSKTQVRVRRLDDFLTEIGVEAQEFGLIWMDTEGHEAKAIKGLESVLRTYPIPLYFEFTPHRQSRKDIDDLIAFIGSYYKTAYLKKETFTEIKLQEIGGLTARHDILLV